MVMIESATKEPVLETALAGPILLAKLPPESLRSRPRRSRTLTQTVAIEAQGFKQVDLRWADVR
jgi:hypothetical protein